MSRNEINPFIKKLTESLENGKTAVNTNTLSAAENAVEVGKKAKETTVHAAERVGTAAAAAASGVGNTGLYVGDEWVNGTNRMRAKFNALPNYTGRRSKYQFRNTNTTKEVDITAKITLDSDNYIKVDISTTPDMKALLNKNLEPWKPKDINTTRFSGGISYKMKKSIRRKKSHRRKSRRRTRL
jgi:hypothetical protein